ncbi:cupin domain-containing protein [Flavobacteriaceae bacterium AU392]|nr:cupin domain-containing protein [Flavobacteriaceae bacterium]RKM85782.1 cupin domain-containing protein [Flavobacteriaceae bacterium AU392]
MDKIESIIQYLDLAPHPEGGYYKETYRSEGEINLDSLSANYSGKRNYSTSIYFLLTSKIVSAFHRINQDEIWHFYDGHPIKIHMISDTGNYSNVIIGNQLSKGQTPQFVVPGHVWFAAEVISDNSYGLVGCTVAPGFDFDDFILPTREELILRFPRHKNIITQFTRQ